MFWVSVRSVLRAADNAELEELSEPLDSVDSFSVDVLLGAVVVLVEVNVVLLGAIVVLLEAIIVLLETICEWCEWCAAVFKCTSA